MAPVNSDIFKLWSLKKAYGIEVAQTGHLRLVFRSSGLDRLVTLSTDYSLVTRLLSW